MRRHQQLLLLLQLDQSVIVEHFWADVYIIKAKLLCIDFVTLKRLFLRAPCRWTFLSLLCLSIVLFLKLVFKGTSFDTVLRIGQSRRYRLLFTINYMLWRHFILDAFQVNIAVSWVNDDAADRPALTVLLKITIWQVESCLRALHRSHTHLSRKFIIILCAFSLHRLDLLCFGVDMIIALIIALRKIFLWYLC